ncbi:MAG TPA: hypothetical protein PKC40_10660, partial [Saprospiraceae bacterium]|nr:hypothetical protein [Saprospiraceae bacterium]
LKNNKLRCYFVENPQSPYYDSPIFQSIFQFIANEGERRGFNLKKSAKNLILAIDGVRSLKRAREVLTGIGEEV